MGNAVSTRLEWADSSKVSLTKDGLPHLQTSLTNQDSLYDMLSMIEQLCHQYPQEAKAEFRKPLIWTSGLTPAAFQAHSSSTSWIVKESSK